MKKIIGIIGALVLVAGVLAPAPAQAHGVVCVYSIYEPVILEAGDRDQIVYGFKHACNYAPDWAYKETQAKILNVFTGKYVDYGAPIKYQCGYGGYGPCKTVYTHFDWTYCVGKNRYKTEGYMEIFHHNWFPWGPYQKPASYGKYIDCTGHRSLPTPDEQATLDAYAEFLGES